MIPTTTASEEEDTSSQNFHDVSDGWISRKFKWPSKRRLLLFIGLILVGIVIIITATLLTVGRSDNEIQETQTNPETPAVTSTSDPNTSRTQEAQTKPETPASTSTRDPHSSTEGQTKPETSAATSTHDPNTSTEGQTKPKTSAATSTRDPYTSTEAQTKPETSAVTSTTEIYTTPRLPSISRSCLDLKSLGPTESGVKQIVNSEDVIQDVYCDMDTDGGGWTLVASIHENDITRKCDSNDKWSAFLSTETPSRDETAWENEKIFGSLDQCTSADYKISAYYSLKANDIMVWHVANGIPLNSSKVESNLRYRTTNGVLNNTGGNLQKLFQRYYPLDFEKDYPSIADSLTTGRSRRAFEAVMKKADVIKSIVGNWHDYNDYFVVGDPPIYYYEPLIYEDEGNLVRFSNSLENSILAYNDERWWGTKSNFSTITGTTPIFVMTGAIGNEAKEFDYFETSVYSNHYSESLDRIRVENDIQIGNFKILFRSISFPLEYYDTACEFHFLVYNEIDWFSEKPASFQLNTQVMYQVYREFGFKADGSPFNFVMGYILLASDNKNAFSPDVLNKVAETILDAFMELPDLFEDFGGSNGISVPITFDEGNATTALNMIPDSLQKYVEPGFLQLRSYNKIGFPNAFCSGIRMQAGYPEYTCVGGISNDVGLKGTCGDYAGWDGGSDADGMDGKSKLAHSEDDINSTILIFYR